MRKLMVFFSLVPVISFAQISHDFESGSLSGWTQVIAGHWAASGLEAISGAYSLRHVFDNPQSGSDQISLFLENLRPQAGNTSWRFQIRHGYPPSGSNHWCVFLMSDQDGSQMHPLGNAKGYALGVNYRGSDDLLRLYRIDGSLSTDLIVTSLNWQLDVGIDRAVGIEVNRSPAGFWTLRVDTTGGFDDLVFAGQATDATHTLAGYFGIYYEYSSLQDLKLWVDDLLIDGSFPADQDPPLVSSLCLLNENQVELRTSEPVQTSQALDPSTYLLTPAGISPSSVVASGSQVFILLFSQPFQQDLVNYLSVSGIADLSGNLLKDTLISFTYHRTMTYEVIVNEIMADPSPVVALPEAEYVELYNNSAYPADLGGWKFICGSTVKILPSRIMQPRSYLVLCDLQATAAFGSIPVLGISSFPALLNTGQSVILKDAADRLISFVQYSDDWYNESYKSEGGWSLEQVDPSNPCGGQGNWRVSVDPTGGTPGRQNSVYAANPDLVPPSISKIVVPTANTLLVWFDEPVDSLGAILGTTYLAEPGPGNPVEAHLLAPGYDVVYLRFDNTFSPGITYVLTITNSLTDCAGNRSTGSLTSVFALPEEAIPGDLAINELLFDPVGQGVDYLEIYNRSGKVIDLANLVVGTRNDLGELKDLKQVVAEGYLLFPGFYLALTQDPGMVMTQYFTHDPDRFLRVNSLPPFNNDEGRVVLLWQWSAILEEFAYHEDMHFPLIRNREGVSLERIHYNRPVNDPTNWHSAAGSVGFGTPGLVNSQFTWQEESEKAVWLEPELFSPDNDGYNDVVSLHYQFAQAGFSGSVSIFDARGRLVRKLMQNQLLGTTGSISWDGLDDDGDRASLGIYLFYAEIFNLNGKVERYKLSCVLAGRLSQ